MSSRQVSVVVLVDPALERDPEDGDPGLGGEARGRVADAAPAQRVGERRGERGELDQLALLELGVRGDDAPGAAGRIRGAPGAARRRPRAPRRPRRSAPPESGASATVLDEQLLQRARAREQHLALVGEVPEERPLREPRPLGDLRDRGLLEPALAVELHRRLLEPAAASGSQRAMRPIVSLMTVADISCYE